MSLVENRQILSPRQWTK